MKQTVSIIGCGWLGLPLAEKLINEGFSVNGTTSTAQKIPLFQQKKINPFLLKFESVKLELPTEFLANSDALIITIPPTGFSIVAYAELFEQLIELSLQNNIKSVIYTSSTSVYGNVSGEVTEETEVKPDTVSAQAIVAVEKLLTNCTDLNSSILRLGGLSGEGRNPGNFFRNSSEMPNANHAVNMVHAHDCIEIIARIIATENFSGIYNVCSPEHPTRAEFYTEAIAKMGKPVPEMLFNFNEIGKIVYSAKISKALNYNFIYQNPMDFLPYC